MKGTVENASNGRPPRQGDQKSQANAKKPFDKKKYRAQKYSNKYKSMSETISRYRLDFMAECLSPWYYCA